MEYRNRDILGSMKLLLKLVMSVVEAIGRITQQLTAVAEYQHLGYREDLYLSMGGMSLKLKLE